ncbi:MAG TPA: DHA2 family efflux MFS transporter permease subunit [Spirochaetota bacterium]|nr:DHA2 family efflux MFS transporter permease subunit [Spirochaetota bacterium]HPC39670.1 DHA2 family efflux MFS transporter permease subunit [Spirochaetota bacterium]HPL19241.1 DHA2 family efflux MFS transporter permease subunit [Spirochaetota bacterium]HQF07397.1 DHA2 family efflux MFS transporter permease subunit [Spirochaetota bacterium]HQH96657.1 DHA2 family efflux MFS transporter permease subunit [Spirochaetota bacterium]
MKNDAHAVKGNLPSDLPHNYRWIVMGIVMIGTMMATLDSSIVNVSIPAIMADFGANVDDIEWVLTGYMIAFATLMPLTAWIRDHIGYKHLYMGSLLVFTLGSVLCGAAWNLESLIGARIIQAFGGGAITPTGMAMISEVFPPEERGKAIGIWGVGVILGPTFGPTLGGYLTKTFGWRSIFLVNLPIGIIALIVASAFLVKDKPHESSHRPFDLWGFIFLTAFLVSFLLGLSKGEKEGWTSAYILTCAAISAVSLVLFLVAEGATDHGIIDLKLFRLPVFSICSLVVLVRSIALFGGVFLMPLFLQQQMGFDEMQSGLIMMPGALMIMFFMPIAGRVGDRVGAMLPSVFGIVLLGWSMFMYRNMDVTMSVFQFIKPTLVRGVGMAFLMAPIMAAALNSVPRNKAGMASSMLNIIMQVAGSIGIALLATVLSNRIHFHLGAVGAAARVNTPAFMEASRQVFYRAHDLGYPYALSKQVAGVIVFKKLSQAAIIMSFQDAFIVGAIIVSIALIPAFFLPRRSNAQKEGPSASGGSGKGPVMME